MLSGTCRFDRGIQSQQVGLLSQVVDHLNDLADVIRALAESGNDFARGMDGGVDPVKSVGGLVHNADTAMHFFAGSIGDIQ